MKVRKARAGGQFLTVAPSPMPITRSKGLGVMGVMGVIVGVRPPAPVRPMCAARNSPCRRLG